MPATLRLVIDITSLGTIPEYQGPSRSLAKKTERYFDDDLSNAPHDWQVAHFGEEVAIRMVTDEAMAWLNDLGTEPTLSSATFTRNKNEI